MFNGVVYEYQDICSSCPNLDLLSGVCKITACVNPNRLINVSQIEEQPRGGQGMSDYISRKDALTDTICEGISCQECPFLINPINGGCKIEDYIQSIPAADVEERNTGTWIIYNPEDIGTTNCRCSNCRTEFFFPAILIRPYAYCPNCGARMEVQSETLQETQE